LVLGVISSSFPSKSRLSEAFKVLKMRVDVSNLFWNRSKERISAMEIPYLLSKIVQFVGSSRIPRPVSLLQLQPLHGVCREGIF
jgi:hypothetical protein